MYGTTKLLCIVYNTYHGKQLGWKWSDLRQCQKTASIECLCTITTFAEFIQVAVKLFDAFLSATISVVK